MACLLECPAPPLKRRVKPTPCILRTPLFAVQGRRATSFVSAPLALVEDRCRTVGAEGLELELVGQGDTKFVNPATSDHFVDRDPRRKITVMPQSKCATHMSHCAIRADGGVQRGGGVQRQDPPPSPAHLDSFGGSRSLVYCGHSVLLMRDILRLWDPCLRAEERAVQNGWAGGRGSGGWKGQSQCALHAY